MGMEGVKEMHFSVWEEGGLSTVNPAVLATAVTKVETLSLWCKLTKDQLQAITAGSRLKSLNTDAVDIDIDIADAHILASAVSRLITVTLHRLSKDQSEALFSAMREGTELRTLELYDSDLSSVDPHLLASGLNKVETFTLIESHSQLTRIQWEAVLTGISQHSQLKHLMVEDSSLSPVDPLILASGLTRLQTVWLIGCNLTPAQCEALCTAIIRGTQLTLSTVDPHLLAIAVNKLENVNLSHCQFSSVQFETLFTAIIRGTQLTELDLSNNYSSFSTVDPLLLAKAVNKLENLNLSYCKLSSVQCETLLNNILLIGNQLKKLNIEFSVRLSTLDPALLAAAKELVDITV